MQKDIKFMDINKAKLIELANFCQISVMDYENRKSFYQQALQLGIDLLMVLKKEYHLSERTPSEK